MGVVGNAYVISQTRNIIDTSLPDVVHISVVLPRGQFLISVRMTPDPQTAHSYF